jgi:hypothetical protein
VRCRIQFADLVSPRRIDDSYHILGYCSAANSVQTKRYLTTGALNLVLISSRVRSITSLIPISRGYQSTSPTYAPRIKSVDVRYPHFLRQPRPGEPLHTGSSSIIGQMHHRKCPYCVFRSASTRVTYEPRPHYPTVIRVNRRAYHFGPHKNPSHPHPLPHAS